MGKFLYFFPFLYRKEHQQSLANPFKVVVVVVVVSAKVIEVICVAAPTPPSSLNLLKESKHWTRANLRQEQKRG